MKYIIALALIAFTACSSARLTSSSVMITDPSLRSGGSGTVLSSTDSRSIILTNRHVCEVIKNGGVVQTDTASAFVIAYKPSETHDLCLIMTAGSLKAGVSVSSYIPQPYDEATVIGHPHLLPTIITKGHFSGKSVISVMTGTRDCSEEEKTNPETGLFCAMFGKLPVVRMYEAIAISNLIQPGSSGSPVFDAAGNVSAVVFAGGGDMSFGYAVPLEYVYNFVNTEAKSLKYTRVNNVINVTAHKEDSDRRSFIENAQRICSTILKDKVNKVCSLLQATTKTSDLIERN